MSAIPPISPTHYSPHHSSSRCEEEDLDIEFLELDDLFPINPPAAPLITGRGSKESSSEGTEIPEFTLEPPAMRKIGFMSEDSPLSHRVMISSRSSLTPSSVTPSPASNISSNFRSASSTSMASLDSPAPSDSPMLFRIINTTNKEFNRTERPMAAPAKRPDLMPLDVTRMNRPQSAIQKSSSSQSPSTSFHSRFSYEAPPSSVSPAISATASPIMELEKKKMKEMANLALQLKQAGLVQPRPKTAKSQLQLAPLPYIPPLALPSSVEFGINRSPSPTSYEPVGSLAAPRKAKNPMH